MTANNRAGPGVGTKFNADGSVRHFPGNTVISMLDPGCALYRALTAITKSLSAVAGSHFSFLPPSSWHMTVFELLCDQVRDAGHWSRFLDTAAPLEATDAFLANAVAGVDPPTGLQLKPRYINTGGGLTVIVDPVEETATKISAYRERLSEVTGIRFPDHDTYQLHIGLAYQIVQPDAQTQTEVSRRIVDAERHLAQISRFEVLTPGLVFFEDMTAFTPTRKPAGQAQ